MNWLWLSLMIGLALFLVGIAVTYFLTRSKGKSRLAVSAVTSIGAIWTTYCSLFAVNWPSAFIVLCLSNNPQKAVDSLQPSWTCIVPSTFLALVISVLLYKLAQREISKNSLPTNASAFELEEGGQSPSVLEMAYAHLIYKIRSRPDRVLFSPGESPYTLPAPAKGVDWRLLIADLLGQIETNLDRDTFRYINQKTFFTMVERDVFDRQKEKIWIVYALEIADTDESILESFDSEIGPLDLSKSNIIKFVVCLRTDEHVDREETTVGGNRVWMVSEAALIRRSLNFTAYATSLVFRFEQKHLPGTNFSLEDCFVDPKFVEISAEDDPLSQSPADQTEKDLLNEIEHWAGQPGVADLSIIGEFGQGKSTAVLAYCAKWASRWLQGAFDERIPLLIELRGKSPKRQAPDRFLAEWGDRYGMRGESLLSLIQTGKVILIFEGFDEIQDAGLRLERFEQFKALWSFSFPNVKIIFTGRPNFFLDSKERENLLKHSSVARQAGLQHSRLLSLVFLDRQGIEEALRKYPDPVKLAIISECSLNSTFFDIAKRPSMVPVIASQWTQIRSDMEKGGGITSSRIIEHFITFLYNRKEADHERLGQYQILHRSVRHYFTQRVAWRMASKELHNTIDIDNFTSVIADGFLEMDTEFRESERADAEVARSIRELKARFNSRPQAELLAAIGTDVRTYGILALDPVGGRDNLYFPHKQYYEFVLGEILAKFVENSKDHSWVKELTRAEVYQMIIREPVSVYFASGLIPNDWDHTQVKSGKVTRIGGRCVGFLGLVALTMETGTLLLFNTPNNKKLLRFRRFLLQLAVDCPPPLKGLIPESRRVILEPAATKGPTRSSALKFLTPRFVSFSVVGAAVATMVLSNFYLMRHGTFQEAIKVLCVVSGTLLFEFGMMTLIFLGRRDAALLKYLLLMEIYRDKALKPVVQKYGKKANSAAILLVKRAVSPRSIAIQHEILLEAVEDIGFDEGDLMNASR